MALTLMSADLANGYYFYFARRYYYYLFKRTDAVLELALSPAKALAMQRKQLVVRSQLFL